MAVMGFSPAVASTDEAETDSDSPNDPAADSTSFEDIVEDPTVDAFRKFEPSVVGILTIRSNRSTVGSGIIISEDGLVLTCQHTVAGLIHVDFVYAVLSDHRIYRAKILGQDEVMDVAVLQLLLNERTDPKLGHIFRIVASLSDQGTPEQIVWDAPLPVAELGNSTGVSIGSQVLAIGFDKIRGSEAQAGIVTSFDEDGGFEHILTDANLYSGYSGGPLIDVTTKQVIGIHSHSVTTFSRRANKSRNTPEIGRERNYVLAIDSIKGSLPLMIGGETIVHATIGNMVFLGLTQDVPKGSLTSGVEIVAIMESNCRGKRAGLREGDVIVEIGGQEVKTARDAEKLIDQAPVGEKMEIVVMRNDNNRKTMKVKPSAKLGKIPNEANEANAIPLLRLIDWIRSRFN